MALQNIMNLNGRNLILIQSQRNPWKDFGILPTYQSDNLIYKCVSEDVYIE